MHVLVTAGNTLVPIDRVRAITNVFTGRTGTRIALRACERGHAVTLLTSHPEVVGESGGPALATTNQPTVLVYRTFDDLRQQLEASVRGGGLDAIIHCAAVSDYQAAGVFAPAAGTHFREGSNQWDTDRGETPLLVDRQAGKVKSDEPELWLRLVRTPKLIDLIRTEWGFRGILVKFKLEVGISDEQLLDVAERSRQQSAADLMVANTLEGTASWAYLGPLGGRYVRIRREELADRLLDAIERLHRELPHG
jgi:phosphopantothenoylcysteine synthetase/decarboxylase